ncbi:uncharacterized protein [Fopius arisanus]|uniref:Uncharacterized protein n=1 Tax=Fopius arisanus TaxID=64838 RepID=A0A9R1UAC2_9HYME|nr:PREDICTED: uncharacterized protein LOC105272580 [Fopius arisanus]
MRDRNLVVQLVGVTFLCLALTSSASRREELERAAELAVERAAERVAEKAVEKALETGNSSTETETIRASHSSVRKYDFTQQLPIYTILTPEQRNEMLRMEKEQEAGELAVKQIKHTLFRRQADDFGPSYGPEGGDDFDDVGPGFGSSSSVEDDIGPGFGSSSGGSGGSGGTKDEDNISPGFESIGRLPFGSLGSSFGRGPLGFSPGLGSTGDFTSSRFVRQYPYGNPYQHSHYQFVPVHQATRVSKPEEPAAPKRKEQPQVVPAIKPLIPPVRIYQVETKPIFYYNPPVNHYAAPFFYQQPQVKFVNQGAEIRPGAGVEGKRQRRVP